MEQENNSAAEENILQFNTKEMDFQKTQEELHKKINFLLDINEKQEFVLKEKLKEIESLKKFSQIESARQLLVNFQTQDQVLLTTQNS